MRGLTSSPAAVVSMVLFPSLRVVRRQLFGAADLLNLRVESFSVRLVRGVGVLPAVLHDARRQNITPSCSLFMAFSAYLCA